MRRAFALWKCSNGDLTALPLDKLPVADVERMARGEWIYCIKTTEVVVHLTLWRNHVVGSGAEHLAVTAWVFRDISPGLRIIWPLESQV